MSYYGMGTKQHDKYREIINYGLVNVDHSLVKRRAIFTRTSLFANKFSEILAHFLLMVNGRLNTGPV